METTLILLIVCTTILSFFFVCGLIAIIILAVQVRKMKKAMKPVKKAVEWISDRGKEIVSRFIEYKFGKKSKK